MHANKAASGKEPNSDEGRRKNSASAGFHTAASWMRMAGADIHTVAQLLGHKDLRMAARYQHLRPKFLADAVTKLDDILKVKIDESTKVLEVGDPVN